MVELYRYQGRYTTIIVNGDNLSNDFIQAFHFDDGISLSLSLFFSCLKIASWWVEQVNLNARIPCGEKMSMLTEMSMGEQ